VSRLRFRILGPLEVEGDGKALVVRGRKPRVVLGALLARAGQLVSVDSLSELLWGEDPPPTARTALQVHVSALRRLLSADFDVAIETRAGGYCLRVDPSAVDAAAFTDLSEGGREAAAAGRWDEAAELLGHALALWRDAPLADVGLSAASLPELTELADRHVAAVEAWTEAMLALGRAGDVLATLERTRSRHPLRERLHRLSALALYRAGRQSEALESLAQLRRTLAAELGIEPSAAIRILESRILAQDPALDLAPASRSVAREGRKTVVALVCRTAVQGSSDPEASRLPAQDQIMRVRDILETREATVLGASGSTIVAVFGVPRMHEDDADRAIDAALKIVAELRTGRIGIAAGEVLVESSGQAETLATTVPLEDATDLAKAAAQAEILVSSVALRLARAVVAEQTEIVLLPNDHPARTVFRVIAAAGTRRGGRSPLVGRAEELDTLRSTLERVRRRGRSSTVTVLGPPGVGKSTLVLAFLSELDDCRVLTGRCLPYGRDITYWAVAQMIREAASITDADPRDAARHKLLRVVRGEPDARFIADQVGSIIGLRDARPVADEVPWAIRTFLRTDAGERPLVLVFEDIHWAEPGLLDLIEHLGATGERTLVVCIAREELLELRSRWGGGRDAMNLVLQPLDEGESQTLLSNLLDGAPSSSEVVQAVLRIAEGNPLFIEELVSMMTDEGAIEWRDGAWQAAADLSEVRTPPSIQSLLAARLDRLPAEERVVLEHASVVGREFSLEDLDAFLALATLETPAVLDRLVQKDALRADRDARGSRVFAFSHQLIHDAAYDAMSKLNRGLAHEAFAEVVERRSGRRLNEVEEIVGYHLEAAERYRSATGLPEDGNAPLALRAADHLSAAGERAFEREDMRSAAGLLSRALALLPGNDARRPSISWRLGIALVEVGRLEHAEEALTAGLAVAERLGDLAGGWRLRMELAELRGWRDTAEDSAAMEEVGERAVAALQAIDDLGGVARAYRLIGDALASRGRLEEAIEKFERARSCAQAAGDERELAQKPNFGVVHSPVPAQRCLEMIRANLERLRRPDPDGLAGLGFVLTMLGDDERAREVFEQAHDRARELGGTWKEANVAMYHGGAMLIADDAKAAEQALRSAVESLQAMGERGLLSSAAGLLAEALFRQGDYEQAMLATMLSEDATAPDDATAETVWLGVRAKILAVRGDTADAESLARRAVAVAATTDFVNMIGDGHLDLAFVLARAGKLEEAIEAAEAAADLFAKKQNRPSFARAAGTVRTLRDRHAAGVAR
jgi:DNA-binding SARP family transcriptional activator